MANATKGVGNPTVIELAAEDDKKGLQAEIAMQWSSGFNESVHTFAKNDEIFWTMLGFMGIYGYTAYAASCDLTDEHLRDEVAQTRPLSATMREKIDRLRLWAKGRAVPAD